MKRPYPHILLFFAIAVGLLACSSRRQNTANALPEELQREAEAASLRAITALRTTTEAIDWDALLFLDFLNRKFGHLKLNLDPLQRADDTQDVFFRIADSAAEISTEELSTYTKGANSLIVRALYCPDHPLPDDFLEQIDAVASKGHYHLTHAVLALQWAWEKGCLSSRKLRAYWHRLIPELVAEANQARLATDLAMEIVSFLYYIGAGDRVHHEWIEAIVKAQRSDGLWSSKPGGATVNFHSSTLALWSLLEAVEPNSKSVAMIVGGHDGTAFD